MRKCWETSSEKRLCSICPAFLKQTPCWTIKQSLCIVGCSEIACYDCPLFNGPITRDTDVKPATMEVGTAGPVEKPVFKSPESEPVPLFMTKTRPFIPPGCSAGNTDDAEGDEERHLIRVVTVQMIVEGIVHIPVGARVTEYIKRTDSQYVRIIAAKIFSGDGHLMYRSDSIIIKKTDIVSITPVRKA